MSLEFREELRLETQPGLLGVHVAHRTRGLNDTTYRASEIKK